MRPFRIHRRQPFWVGWLLAEPGWDSAGWVLALVRDFQVPTISRPRVSISLQDDVRRWASEISNLVAYVFQSRTSSYH
ncbi:hypothetical protein F4778DRAFT_754099 [Xylariomycetidae sp. FL2044]|nr:hypothetical protein F4778DRAFT_754099 [Xylariomycetidae sp. FL2044]